MTKLKAVLKSSFVPMILMLLSVLVFLFSGNLITSDPGLTPGTIFGYEFIIGFTTPIGSIPDPGNQVTGLGFSAILLLIPVMGLSGIVLLVLEMFKVDIPNVKVIVMVLFIVVGILCLLPVQLASYYRIAETGTQFIPLNSEDLHLSFGGYMSGFFAFISAGLLGIDMIELKKKTN